MQRIVSNQQIPTSVATLQLNSNQGISAVDFEGLMRKEPCVRQIELSTFRNGAQESVNIAFIVVEEQEVYKYLDQSHREPEDYERLVHQLIENRVDSICRRKLSRDTKPIHCCFVDKLPSEINVC